MDITPTRFPVSMVGSFNDRKATAAHDPLTVRCLALDDGSTRAAIVAVDVCILPREVCDEAKRLASAATGLGTDRILIAATHTHTAPPTTVLNDIPVDPEFPATIARKIPEAIAQALARLAPVQAGWGVTRLPGDVFNRRWFLKKDALAPNPFGHIDRVQMNPAVASPALERPAGPTDPDVTVLSLRAPAGGPVAFLANYSLHYVGDVPPGVLSADYFGEFCRQIETRLGAGSGRGTPPPVAILTNGTSGDVNNVDRRHPAQRGEVFSRIRAVAGRVAAAALGAVEDVGHGAGATLAMAEGELELAVRRPDPAALERAKAVVARADDAGLPRLARYYAQQAIRLSEYPPTVLLKIQALRVGGLGIVTIPCEAFAEVGLEIKRRSPIQPTCVIDLANGYNGYLPTPEQHALGGYETWAATSSYLETTASRRIIAEALRLLQQVRPAPAGAGRR